MLKIVKVLFSLACFAALVYFGYTVPLGDRTLFGHLRAIGGSPESQRLYQGTKDKVTGLFGGHDGGDKRKVSDRRPGKGGAPSESGDHLATSPSEEVKAAEQAPPQDKISSADREQMRRLLESHRPKSPQ